MLEKSRQLREAMQREMHSDYERLDVSCRRHGVTGKMFKTVKFLYQIAVLAFSVYLIEYAAMTPTVALGGSIILIAGVDGLEAYLIKQGIITDGGETR